METVLGMTDLQIKLFTALGQLSVAGIVGYIAWQQWRTARKKLKADLFDKRHAAYRSLFDEVQELFDDETLVEDPRPAHRRLERIRRTGMEMEWLCSSSVAKIASRVHEHCIEFVFAAIDAKECLPSARAEPLRRLMAADAQVAAELANLLDALGPYLKLDH